MFWWIWIAPTTLLTAIASKYVQNLVAGYSLVRLRQAADLEAMLGCQTSLSYMATGYRAFCETSAVGASRPFAAQLALHAWNELPWCGPFKCDAESGIQSLVSSLAALLILTYITLQLVKQVVVRRKRRKSPGYAMIKT